MSRGDLYRVRHPGGDPKRARAFVVVSRPGLIRSSFPTVICAPVHTARHGLHTEVAVGIDEGLKHDSSIQCDALVSLPKAVLTDFIGALAAEKIRALNVALRVAVGVA
jgi:mRNA interferase MazF